ncbi:S-adenosyl-L-methionine-dependent methyltransferase, partial [Crucibulum laeve]
MLPPHRHSQDGDAPIRATDNDAALARLSAVQKGYFDDPFITYLVPRAHLQPPRPPLINVGTFVRSQAIDNLVDQWLSFSKAGNRPCQIVSLGAGSDTRFWRIANGPHKDILAAYVEVDFPEVTTKKAMVIRKNLSEALGSPSDIHIIHGGTGVRSPKYHLIPADLRLPPSEKLENLLFSPNSDSSSTEDKPILSTSLPTLLLFECVLVYVSPSQSSRLLGWFVDKFSKSESIDGILGCIVYEMFGLNDAFGRVMVNNLKARNVFLPGAEPYPTIDRVPAKF